MADATYQPKIYRKQGGNELVAASGATVTVESGATETHANNPAFSGNPSFTGTPDFSGAAGVTMKAGSVTAASLGANLQTGFIPINLSGARVIATNDITAKGAADGGTVSLDTDPTYKRVNAATDKQARLAWAANSVVEVQLPGFAYPPDLDDTQALTVHLLVDKDGNVNATANIAVAYFENVGDTNAGGNTAALTETTPTEKTVVIAAADVGPAPAVAALTLTPSAHANDAIRVYAAWVTYTRKT